ncbi:MAG: SocA family protein [Desulfovibrio sp.]|jgi:hypothetical protein|nr:SocA family protein [Desulfovibrio sp.]
MQNFMQDVLSKLGENKLQEMAHMIVDTSPLGITGSHKLRALLWLCDKAMYLQRGKTISDKIYIKGSLGPELRDSRAYTLNASPNKPFVKRAPRLFLGEEAEYISLRTPIFMSLSPEEREVIKNTVEQYVSAELVDVLAAARGHAWEITEWGKPILMHAVLADKARDLTPED